MLPVALEYPPGIEMVSVCTCLLGEEGRVSFGGYKTINRIPLPSLPLTEEFKDKKHT